MKGGIRRAELILFLRETFFTTHLLTKGAERSLGRHLMGVFDLLIDAGCDIDICIAGALHSIYGTSYFSKVTVIASNENRNGIRIKFGVRVERLAFYFHACSRKAVNNIEYGVLYDRKNSYPMADVKLADIQALRLIEAANFIEQRPEFDFATHPNIYRLWTSQLQLKRHNEASLNVSRNTSKSCTSILFPVVNCHKVLRLRVYPYENKNRVGKKGENEYKNSNKNIDKKNNNSKRNNKFGEDVFVTLRNESDFEVAYAKLSSILDKYHDEEISDEVDEKNNSVCLDLSARSSRSKNNCTAPKIENVNNGNKVDTTVSDRVNSVDYNIDNIKNLIDKTDNFEDKKGKKDENRNGNENENENDKKIIASQRWLIAFTLRGESKMGMSWSPLWMLERYLSCNCSHDSNIINNNLKSWSSFSKLEIDIKYLKPNNDDANNYDIMYDYSKNDDYYHQYTNNSNNNSNNKNNNDDNNNINSNNNCEVLSNIYNRLSNISQSMNLFRAGPPPVPLSDITMSSSHCHKIGCKIQCAESRSKICASSTILDSLIAYGYAVISVDQVSARTIQCAYDALLRFHLSTSLKDKKNSFYQFDGGRYIGYAADNGREWLQMRVTYDENNVSSIPFLWPENISIADRNYLSEATKLLTKSAEEIFEEIGILLNIGDRSYLHELCRGKKNINPCSKSTDLNSNKNLGSSVCRQFIYLDKPISKNVKNKNLKNNRKSEKFENLLKSAKLNVLTERVPEAENVKTKEGMMLKVKKTNSTIKRKSSLRPSFASSFHSDMGLLTLSPSSTIPALTLIHPHTHTILYPEKDLKSNEWILFAGETLSFLTGGAIQAPIHAVPFIDRSMIGMNISTNKDTIASSKTNTNTITSMNRSFDSFKDPSVRTKLLPLRRSMPLFLRANPDMILYHKNQKEDQVSSVHSSVRTPGDEEETTFLSSSSRVRERQGLKEEEEIKRRGEVTVEECTLDVEEKGKSHNTDTIMGDVEDCEKTPCIKKEIEIEEDGMERGQRLKSPEEIDDTLVTTIQVATVTTTAPATSSTLSTTSLSSSSSSSSLATPAAAAAAVSMDSFILSPRAMTCREYMETHIMGLRPWRLGKASGDF